MTLAGRVAEHLTRLKTELGRWDACYIDEGAMGAGVVDRLHQLEFRVMGVNFGWASDRDIPGHPACGNKRAEMWSTMREEMRRGLGLPDDPRLALELQAPTYHYDAQNRIMLEKKEDMKKRGVASPDRADGLALTYAYPVQPKTSEDLAAEREMEEQTVYGNGWG